MDNLRIPLYIGALLVGFLLWQRWEAEHAPPPPPPQQPTATNDMPADTGGTGGAGGNFDDVPAAVDTPHADTPPTDAPSVARKSEREHRHIRVVTDVFDIDISPRGGDITRLDLLQVLRSLDNPVPLRLFDTDATTYVAQSGLRHDRVSNGADLDALAPSHRALFAVEQNDYRLTDGEEFLRVPLRWKGANGITVDKNYIFKRDSYVIRIEHTVRNDSGKTWTGRQYRQLRRATPREEGSQLIYTFTGASYYDGEKFNKIEFEDLEKNGAFKSLRNSWIAMLQHYFVSAFVPNPGEEETVYTRVISAANAPEYIIGLHSQAQSIADGDTKQFVTRLFAGPKIQSRLEKVAEGLELTVDYGVLSIIAQPMFYALEFIYDWVGNWGFAIILLTILIKLIFYKLSEMSYRSMARMRKFQPRFSALRERYKDNREQLNKAVMELYRKEKINPLGGCLPILVQVPFFIALYWTLLESAELRQAPFIFWLQDLSVRDPYFILPVLMGATMIFQTSLNPTPPDPMQAKVMKYMPYVFTLFFAFFPSGLVLYWLVNNILSIAQQWYITRQIERADN